MSNVLLDNADHNTQWYQGAYPNAATFYRLDKFLVHTTETVFFPGYSGGASAPNATYDPRTRRIRQHFGANRSARALRDPSWTAVRENRDNVFQLEIVCYSAKNISETVSGLWVGDLTATHMRDIAAILLELHAKLGLPLQSSVTWREGRTSFYDDVRLTGSQYDAYRGILGHVHASGNTHWDPGGFRYSKLDSAIGYQLASHPIYGGGTSGGGGTTLPPPPEPEDIVATIAEVKDALRDVLSEGMIARYDPETGQNQQKDGADKLYGIDNTLYWILRDTRDGRDRAASLDEALIAAKTEIVAMIGQVSTGQLSADQVAEAIIARVHEATAPTT